MRLFAMALLSSVYLAVGTWGMGSCTPSDLVWWAGLFLAFMSGFSLRSAIDCSFERSLERLRAEMLAREGLL